MKKYCTGKAAQHDLHAAVVVWAGQALFVTDARSIAVDVILHPAVAGPISRDERLTNDPRFPNSPPKYSIGTRSLKSQPGLQAWGTQARKKFKFEADGCLGFRLGFQAWIPGLRCGIGFQVWISGLGFRLGFQACTAGLDLRFGFHIGTSSLDLAQARPQAKSAEACPQHSPGRVHQGF